MPDVAAWSIGVVVDRGEGEELNCIKEMYCCYFYYETSSLRHVYHFYTNC